VERHPSAPTTPLAVLKLAKGYYDSGNHDMALGKYDEFLKEFADHPFAPAAELGRVHCLEARAQLHEALEGYRSFAANRPDHFLAPQAILAQARCLEQLGQLAEARTVYEDFITSAGETMWRNRAEQLLETIEDRQKVSLPARSDLGPVWDVGWPAATETNAAEEPAPPPADVPVPTGSPPPAVEG
jgi:tetratricopeptide (TPR) repeat protein